MESILMSILLLRCYVEVTVRSGKLPDWHPGKGNSAFIFVDELNLY